MDDTVMMVSGDVDLDDPEMAEAMEDIRQAGARRLAAMPRKLAPGDPWPGGISDGLASLCVDCEVSPLEDYTVTDDFWSQWGAGPAVLCLGCLGARCRGEGLPEALLSIQVAGGGVTVVLRPVEAWDYTEWSLPKEPPE